MEHVAELSREFGTRVEVEEEEDGTVVGWVTGGGQKKGGAGPLAGPAGTTSERSEVEQKAEEAAAKTPVTAVEDGKSRLRGAL